MWKDLFLWIIQGLAEIFPVSSSGHLTIFGLVLDKPITFNQLIIMHIGTFLAIFIYYRKEVWEIASGRFGRTLPLYFATSFAATGVVGLMFRDLAAKITTEQTNMVSVLLVLNGIFLGLVGAFSRQGKRQIVQLTALEFVAIGLIQGVTAVPGISRLGWTLGLGLLIGLSWFEALTLSFLLSLPTILFANLYIWFEQLFRGWVGLGVGGEGTVAYASPVLFTEWLTVPVTFICGLLALHMLSKYLGRKLLIYFGVYCIAAGLFFLYFVKLL
jgi:undecaprenyl-diphosphatase